MERNAASTIVTAFVNAICANDVPAMAALITDDHRFIDSRENAVDGRRAVVALWTEFFRNHAGYRALVETSFVRGDEVFMTGQTEGGPRSMDGHALWRARIRDGRIGEWQVHRAPRPIEYEDAITSEAPAASAHDRQPQR